MYSFNFTSFINRFSRLDQSQTKNAEPKPEAKKQTVYTKVPKYTKDSYNKTFTDLINDQYIKTEKKPTVTKSYTDRVIGRQIDYTKTSAWKRANTLRPNQIDYTKPNAWQSINRRVSSSINLFNSAIRNPFSYSNNSYGAFSWA